MKTSHKKKLKYEVAQGILLDKYTFLLLSQTGERNVFSHGVPRNNASNETDKNRIVNEEKEVRN